MSAAEEEVIDCVFEADCDSCDGTGKKYLWGPHLVLNKIPCRCATCQGTGRVPVEDDEEEDDVGG